MSHKHVGQGLNFVPQDDGSVKVQKLWRNLPDGVELEVHISKQEWLKVIEHCKHDEPSCVEGVEISEEIRDMNKLQSEDEAVALAKSVAKDAPKKKGLFK
jgi:hypothetical protein